MQYYILSLFTSNRSEIIFKVWLKKQHLPVEEVLSDEDLFRVGLQFILSDGRWEDLSKVVWEPGETGKDRNHRKIQV